MRLPFVLRTAALAGALVSATLSAHADSVAIGPYVDAGDVRVQPWLGSYTILSDGGWNSGSLYQNASIQNGISFNPSTTSWASAYSNDTYRSAGTMLVDLKAAFQPEAGFHITGYQVSLTGKYKATGSGRAKLWVGLSNSGESNTDPVFDWYQQGAGEKAFTWNHVFNFGNSAPTLALQASTEANYFSFCHPDLGCTTSYGEAMVTLSEVKWQALVTADAVTPAVPEADGAWMAGAALVLFGGAATRRRRRSRG